MVRAADCVRSLLADADAGVIGAVHAGRPGVAARRRPARPSAACASCGAARPRRVGRTARVRGLLRGAGRDARRGRRPWCPRRGPTTSWGTPPSTSAPACGPSSSAPASRSSTVAAARARTTDLHSYRRDGAAAGPLRRTGLDDAMSRLDELARRPRRRTPSHRDRLRRGRTRPERRRHPGRRHQVLPGLRRTAAGRPRRHRRGGEPPPGGARPRRPSAPTSACAGTSSAACSPTRPPRSRRTPTWSSRSTAPSCVGRSRRGARTSGRTTLDVLLQVSLDPPGATTGPARDPADLGDARPTRWTRRDAAAARADGGGAARRGPRRRPSRGSPQIRADFLADHPDATVLSAGMSGDLEAAIAHGATHVRVGSAVLGPRPRIK